MEREDTYTDFMSDVDGCRKLSYRILYEQYALPKGITKQQMFEECVTLGMESFLKLFPEAKDVDDAKRLMKTEFTKMTDNECLTSFSDHGVVVITKREFGTENAWEFLSLFKYEYEDEIRKLLSDES